MIPPKTPHMSKARADARAFDMKALRKSFFTEALRKIARLAGDRIHALDNAGPCGRE